MSEKLLKELWETFQQKGRMEAVKEFSEKYDYTESYVLFELDAMIDNAYSFYYGG